MQFPIPVKKRLNLERYPREDMALAREFSKGIFNEFGRFVKAIVVFGSTVRGKKNNNDIDIMVIIDDTTVQMTPELADTYRIIIQKTIAKVSTRLHVISLKFTSFWEYVRVGDPIAMNILRDGVAIIDCGFFDPVQNLLFQGRIRPSKESVWTYFARSPTTMLNSKWHVNQAALDLYWAVIDSAHAVLMNEGIIPPSPEHVAELLEKRLGGKIGHTYVNTMRKFYTLMKKLTHKEIKGISGREYDALYEEAKKFVDKMRTFIDIDDRVVPKI